MMLEWLSGVLGFLAFWRRQAVAEERLALARATADRDLQRLTLQERQAEVDAVTALRDNLRGRIQDETDPSVSEVLRTQLAATEDALTQLLLDGVADMPRFRYYYAEAMRALVPREIGPEPPVPEPVRETAVLVERVGQAAGLTPQDAEGHFLRGNALSFKDQFREAVAAYDQALTFYTREALPQGWAATQNNRGNALQSLGERPEGEAGQRALSDAIAAYDLALEVYTREALPQGWPATQNNRGNALTRLGERLEGEAGQRALRDAIAAYDRALEVYTREALPQDWAMTQNNRGNALQSLGERLEGKAGQRALSDAIAAFDRALEVWTAEYFPFLHSQTQRNRERAARLLGERGG